jgi:large subunit ribosomal protein L29
VASPVEEKIMKASDLRAMSDEELERKLGESRQELFKVRFQAATGALESSARLRHAKREIARILTIKNERTMSHG